MQWELLGLRVALHRTSAKAAAKAKNAVSYSVRIASIISPSIFYASEKICSQRQ